MKKKKPTPKKKPVKKPVKPKKRGRKEWTAKVNSIYKTCLDSHPHFKKGLDDWRDELLHGFSWKDEPYDTMSNEDWIKDCVLYAKEAQDLELE